MSDKAALDLQNFHPKLHIVLNLTRCHRAWMDTVNLNARHPALAVSKASSSVSASSASTSFSSSASVSSSTTVSMVGNSLGKARKNSGAREVKKYQKSLQKTKLQILGVYKPLAQIPRSIGPLPEIWASGCRRCKDLEESFRCLRNVYVDAKSAELLRQIEGRPLTEADENDRLPSLKDVSLKDLFPK